MFVSTIHHLKSELMHTGAMHGAMIVLIVSYTSNLMIKA